MSRRTFDAFHLPASTFNAPLRTLRAGSLVCRYPDPAQALLEDSLEALREARELLRQRPVAEIVDVIDAAAARLADPGRARNLAAGWDGTARRTR